VRSGAVLPTAADRLGGADRLVGTVPSCPMTTGDCSYSRGTELGDGMALGDANVSSATRGVPPAEESTGIATTSPITVLPTAALNAMRPPRPRGARRANRKDRRDAERWRTGDLAGSVTVRYLTETNG